MNQKFILRIMQILNFFISFIKKYWKSIYLFLLGIFWIGYFIYIRLIIERKGYTLEDIQTNYPTTNIFFDVFIIFLHIIFLSYALYNIYIDYKLFYKKDPNFKGEMPTFSILVKLSSIIDFLFTQPLIYTRELVAPKIQGLNYILYLFRVYADKYNFYKRGYLLVFIFYGLPRIIVATVFFVEIIFFHQIHYFIRSLILLIIPLLWLVFVDLLAARATRGFETIKKYFDIMPIGKMGPQGIHEDGYYLLFKKGYIYDDACIESFQNEFNTCVDSLRLSIGILTVYKIIAASYITLYCSSLYIMGFTYKIFFIFF